MVRVVAAAAGVAAVVRVLAALVAVAAVVQVVAGAAVVAAVVRAVTGAAAVAGAAVGPSRARRAHAGVPVEWFALQPGANMGLCAQFWRLP